MTVRPPGSKSHTIRALFAAAGATGVSALSGPLDSDDTQRARECLAALGAGFNETGGVWSVTGLGGGFGAPGGPLDAGESGLTARFLMALTPFIPAAVVIEGRGRLPERPMDALLDNLAGRGAEIGAGYPWRIDATAAGKAGRLLVDAATSSQMVSALMLAAPLADEPTELVVTNMDSSAQYVALTTEVMEAFGAQVDTTAAGYRIEGGGYAATTYEVPIDASSAVYPACAAALTGGVVEVLGDMGNHPDRRIVDVLVEMGCSAETTPDGMTVHGPARLVPIDVDMSSAPDAAVCLAIVCARAAGSSRISGLESLRHKESDRLSALHTELTRFGASIVTDSDSIEIAPGVAAPVEFEVYNDHRIAMSLALLGLVVGGVTVRNPEVVNKTWPGYWEWLASTGAVLTKSE
ncbi:MAG: 3-phosphoshikimate 1-carboxyvinyltransferase [Acidimicrobiia bacterium]